MKKDGEKERRGTVEKKGCFSPVAPSPRLSRSMSHTSTKDPFRVLVVDDERGARMALEVPVASKRL